MSIETFTPTPLLFTPGAANKVKTLIDEEGNPRLKLRVFVTGGGCSGFQYGFTFDEDIADDDTVIEARWRGPGGGPDELPVPGGLGSRLPGRPGRFEVRHQEPERRHDLRLRTVVLDLTSMGRYENAALICAAFSFQAGYSAPRVLGPSAPVTSGQLPGRRSRNRWASQANAMPSIQAGECRIRRYWRPGASGISMARRFISAVLKRRRRIPAPLRSPAGRPAAIR